MSAPAGPAVRMLVIGGHLVARALPLDAHTLKREAKGRALSWRVSGWARALPPAAGAAILAPISFLFLQLGEPGLGPAVVLGVVAAALLGTGWLRGAFHGGMEVKADGAGVQLRQGRRTRRVPRSTIRAVQLFGQEYWEFSQYGGWRVRYALGLDLGDHTLVVAHSRRAAALARAARELAATLRLPTEPAQDGQAPPPKKP